MPGRDITNQRDYQAPDYMQKTQSRQNSSIENKLFSMFQKLLELEKDLEKQKVHLSLKCDFNLIDAFRILDPHGQGSISQADIGQGL